MQGLFVTSHAIDRYRQRVRPTATRLEAVADIRTIAAKARSRSRPRWWTRVAGVRTGCRYLYAADRPAVCLVVTGGAVVTVFSRAVCASWRAAASRTGWATLSGGAFAGAPRPITDLEAA
jgi:hypothetical protein